MLNAYFKRHEFRCRGMDVGICSCGLATVDHFSLEVVTAARIYFNAKCIVTSGCRCFEYNEHVQKVKNSNYVPGSSKSQHMKLWAIDHFIEGVAPEQLYRFYNDMFPEKYGLGLYTDFVHFDPRPYRTRW